MHQFFSCHSTPAKFKNARKHRWFWFCVWGKLGQLGKSNYYRDVIDFEQLRFQNVFRPRRKKRKVGVFNFLWFEERFQKLRLRDGLMWMVDLTVSNSPAYCGDASGSNIFHDVSWYVKLLKYQFIVEIRDSGTFDSVSICRGFVRNLLFLSFIFAYDTDLLQLAYYLHDG